MSGDLHSNMKVLVLKIVNKNGYSLIKLQKIFFNLILVLQGEE